MEHSAYWRGREWTIRAVEDDEDCDVMIGVDKMAVIHSGQALILYRASLSEDAAIMSVLHEAAHEMYPQWEKEPVESSTSEVGVFERDVKAFLEAFNVDLSPLLPQPEVEPSNDHTS